MTYISGRFLGFPKGGCSGRLVRKSHYFYQKPKNVAPTLASGSSVFLRHGNGALVLTLLPKLLLHFSRQPRRRCRFPRCVCIRTFRVAQNLNTCCWVPAVAEARSPCGTLEPVQARGGNPGLLVGPDPSFRGAGEAAGSGQTLAGVALRPERCLPLRGGPAVSFGRLGLAPIPGTLLWVCRWQLLHVRERGRGLDARAPVGCAKGGASAGFGAPPPSLEQGVQVDPALWAEAADAGSEVSLGREGSPCPAPGMAEDGRDRDLLSKRSCFFSHPYSLFINLVQFHNSQTCKAAGLFLFCLNLSEPAKFLGLARGAASTHGLPGLAWSRSLQMFSAGSGA